MEADMTADELLNDAKTIYLPDNKFSKIENMMLKGDIASGRIVPVDELDQHDSPSVVPMLAYHAYKAHELMVDRPYAFHFCVVENIKDNTMTTVRLDESAYCVCVSTSIISEIYMNAQMMCIHHDIVTLFDLDRPLFHLHEIMVPNATFRQLRSAISGTKYQKSDCLGLFSMSILYALWHEISHIEHGHIDFKVSHRTEINELDERDKGLLYNALEYDADWKAIDLSYRYLNTAQTGLAPIFKLLLPDRNRDKLICLCLFGALGSFQMRSLSEIIADYDPLIHPPMRWRALGVIETLYEVVKQRGRLDPETTIARMSIASKVAASYLKTVAMGNAGSVQYMERWKLENTTRHQHLHEVLSAWASIRPTLSKFVRIRGNLAPAQAEPNERLIFTSK